MLIYKISDTIVFKALKSIKYGFLEITKIDGEILKFGNPEDSLKANLVIKKSNFSYNLIRGGSVGFAESYMRGDFETDNLSNLIESYHLLKSLFQKLENLRYYNLLTRVFYLYVF